MVKSMESFVWIALLLSGVTVLPCHATPLPPTPSGQGDLERYPYILFSTSQKIVKMNIGSDQSQPEIFYREDSGQITSMDYHFRLGHLYWSTANPPLIRRMFLNGTGTKTILSLRHGLREPVSVAVDWITDELYWVDKTTTKIGCIDLVTNIRRTVLQLDSLNRPLDIAVYPKPMNRLYWVDKNGCQLSSVGTNGNNRTMIEFSSPYCPQTVTIDYRKSRVYVSDTRTDSVTYVEETVRHVARFTTPSSLHAHSIIKDITVFGEKVYWVEPNVGLLSSSLDDGSTIEVVYPVPSTQSLTAVRVVDPSAQLSEAELTAAILCTEPCVHGVCRHPGHCVCDSGWTGPTCSDDINECESVPNGGCEHHCRNWKGGYECTCNPDGFALGADGRSCIVLAADDPIRASPDFIAASSVAIAASSDVMTTSPNVMTTSPNVMATSPDVMEASTNSPQTTTTVKTPSLPAFTTSQLPQPSTHISPSSTYSLSQSSVDMTSSTPVAESSSAVSLAPTYSRSSSSAVSLAPTYSRSSSSAVSLAPTPSLGDTVSMPTTGAGIILPTTTETKEIQQITSFTSGGQEMLPPSPKAPIDTLNNADDTEKPSVALIVGVVVSFGVISLVAVVVCYSVLLCYKYNPRRGYYSPRRFEKRFNPARTSFRMISDNNESASMPHQTISLSSESLSDSQSFTWRDSQ